MATKSFDELDLEVMKKFKRREIYEEEEKDLTKKEGIICPKGVLQRDVNTDLPAFEYLLSTLDFTKNLTEDELESNIEAVKEIINESFYSSKDIEKLKYRLKNTDKSIEIIDQIKVYSNEKSKDFLGDTVNTGFSKLIVYQDVIEENPKLLNNNYVWSKIGIKFNYNENEKKAEYSVVDIEQLSIKNFEDFKDLYSEAINEFKYEEKMNILLRSIGIEPNKLKIKDKFNLDTLNFKFRAKELLLLRLIPLVEKNYNLMEIGEKGIGKSYLQKLSPHTVSYSAASVTYANLFGDNRYSSNNADVGLYDVIYIDEISKGDFKEKEVIENINTYMTDGFYKKSNNAEKQEVVAHTSFVFTGNNHKSVESLIRSSEYNLFSPCIGAIENDPTIQDRINFYIPGWELEEFPNDIGTTNHLGLTADFLFDLFHYLREEDYTDVLEDNGFKPNKNVSNRDEQSIKMTVSGLVKLLHASPVNVGREILEEYLILAIEGRNRVKFQKNSTTSYEDMEIVYKDVEGEYDREIKALTLELDAIKKGSKIELQSREVELISERNMREFNLELFERLTRELNNRKRKIIAVNAKEFYKSYDKYKYNFELTIEKYADEINVTIYDDEVAPKPSPHIALFFKKVAESVGVETNSHILDSYIKTYTVIRDKLIDLFTRHPEIQRELRLPQNRYTVLNENDYKELGFDPYINDDIKLEINYEYNYHREDVLICNYGGINIEFKWDLDLEQRKYLNNKYGHYIEGSLSRDITNYI